jgi:hypothetical protein
LTGQPRNCKWLIAPGGTQSYGSTALGVNGNCESIDRDQRPQENGRHETGVVTCSLAPSSSHHKPVCDALLLTLSSFFEAWISHIHDQLANAQAGVATEKVGHLARPDRTNPSVTVDGWVEGHKFRDTTLTLERNQLDTPWAMYETPLSRAWIARTRTGPFFQSQRAKPFPVTE